VETRSRMTGLDQSITHQVGQKRQRQIREALLKQKGRVREPGLIHPFMIGLTRVNIGRT